MLAEPAAHSTRRSRIGTPALQRADYGNAKNKHDQERDFALGKAICDPGKERQ